MTESRCLLISSIVLGAIWAARATVNVNTLPAVSSTASIGYEAGGSVDATPVDTKSTRAPRATSNEASRALATARNKLLNSGLLERTASDPHDTKIGLANTTHNAQPVTQLQVKSYKQALGFWTAATTNASENGSGATPVVANGNRKLNSICNDDPKVSIVPSAGGFRTECIVSLYVNYAPFGAGVTINRCSGWFADTDKVVTAGHCVWLGGNYIAVQQAPNNNYGEVCCAPAANTAGQIFPSCQPAATFGIINALVTTGWKRTATSTNSGNNYYDGGADAAILLVQPYGNTNTAVYGLQMAYGPYSGGPELPLPPWCPQQTMRYSGWPGGGGGPGCPAVGAPPNVLYTSVISADNSAALNSYGCIEGNQVAGSGAAVPPEIVLKAAGCEGMSGGMVTAFDPFSLDANNPYVAVALIHAGAITCPDQFPLIVVRLGAIGAAGAEGAGIYLDSLIDAI